ncbi:hypothetical protein AA0116_g6284 [Alternaria tenuissima]|nr:hypothetical protein AA0116_g6284 [Alternaria tenuissima]
MPEDAEDERLQKRIIQVLKPTSQCYEDTSEDKEDMAGSWAMSAKIRVGRTGVRPDPAEGQLDERDTVSEDGVEQWDAQYTTVSEDSAAQSERDEERSQNKLSRRTWLADTSSAQLSELERLWLEALKDDRQYRDAKQAVVDQERKVPTEHRCEMLYLRVLDKRPRRAVVSWQEVGAEQRACAPKLSAKSHDSLSTGRRKRTMRAPLSSIPDLPPQHTHKTDGVIKTWSLTDETVVWEAYIWERLHPEDLGAMERMVGVKHTSAIHGLGNGHSSMARRNIDQEYRHSSCNMVLT